MEAQNNQSSNTTFCPENAAVVFCCLRAAHDGCSDASAAADADDAEAAEAAAVGAVNGVLAMGFDATAVAPACAPAATCGRADRLPSADADTGADDDGARCCKWALTM